MRSEAAALDRMLEAVSGCFTLESARRVAEVRADPELQARLDELAYKSTEGKLTDDERSEYETYVRGLEFIAILQAKARTALSKPRRSRF